MTRTVRLIPLVLAALGGCADATGPREVLTLDDAVRAARLPAFGFNLSSISAGSSGGCGVSAGGNALLLGKNAHGTLGNGTTDWSGVPVPVSGGLTFTSGGGNAFATCGLTKGGRAYCWGNGWLGQLGDGTRGSSPVPVPVSGGITFTTLSSSRFAFGGSAAAWRRADKPTAGASAAKASWVTARARPASTSIRRSRSWAG